MQPGRRSRQILAFEEQGTRHQQVCSRGAQGRRFLAPDPPIHLDLDPVRIPVGFQQGAHPLDARAGQGRKVLPFNPHGRPHQQDQVDLSQERQDLLGSSSQAETQAGAHAGVPDFPDGRASQGAKVAVHCHQVSPGAGKIVDQAEGVLHHQVDVKGPGGQRSQAGDQVGEEQQARHEMRVADVEMIQVDAAVHPPEFIRQVGEISGPDGGI